MKTTLPSLPIEKWENSKITLHLIFQIIGKIRLKMTPRKNHWWFITLYVSPRGFTTSAVPFDNGRNTFEIQVDVLSNRIQISSSMAEERLIPLEDGTTVSEYYARISSVLDELGIKADILARPFDVGIDKNFEDISEYHHYDPEYVRRFWKIMLWVDGVMNEFSGRFYGKTCPVHIYWHHMDLAVTRFSGKKAPPLDPSARISDKDAYSHEVISFGFWAGDPEVREPAFYAYTYPSPEGLDNEPLLPETATWIDNNGSPMAFLRYEDFRNEADPRKSLLDFLESSYQAGAKKAGWDIDGFKTPGLEDL